VSRKVVFKTDKGVTVTATLNDSRTADVLIEKLPIESLAQTRGAEVYFFVELGVEPGETTEEAPAGALAYWPAGSALSIFYGGDPITPVEIVDRIDGDANQMRTVIAGDEVTLEKA
jgi:hypothetical protein